MYKSKKPYFYGTGRRKSSVARVHLFPNGTGTITINGIYVDGANRLFRGAISGSRREGPALAAALARQLKEGAQ